jgi:hypothetical protein
MSLIYVTYSTVKGLNVNMVEMFLVGIIGVVREINVSKIVNQLNQLCCTCRCLFMYHVVGRPREMFIIPTVCYLIRLNGWN